MRKLSVAIGLALALLAARPAAAEFISYYDGAQSEGYGISFSVGDSYSCPDPYYSDPYAVTAPAYVPASVVVYPPPPVVAYQPPVIYRSVIIHRPIVEKRVIVRQVVRQPVVVKRHVVKQHAVVPKRHFERPGRHGTGLPPGLQRIGHRR